jgi:DNA-directed RNA polymerase specialized sigma24 family protein
MEPHMLDADNLTRILLKKTPFIMSRGIRVGFKGEDLLDFGQETALQLWRNRESWPNDVESEMALIRHHADATAIDMLRTYKARKRDAPSLSLTGPDGRELAEALRVEPMQENHFLISLIRHAIRVVAATLSPELERVIISRMLNGDGEEFSKNENQRALRAVRHAIELPAEEPQLAGVTDSFEHLMRTSRRIEAAAEAARRTHDFTQETTCANDVMTSTRENESLKSSEHRAMSGYGPSQSRTLWSATAAAINNTNSACESTPGPRSLLPQSGSAFSRRQASSGSTPTSASSRHARRPEATLVTRHQMYEDSSQSQSNG